MGGGNEAGVDVLDVGQDAGDVIDPAAEGLQDQQVGGGFRQDDPFAAAGPHEGADLERRRWR